jgi:hypothetical protein
MAKVAQGEPSSAARELLPGFWRASGLSGRTKYTPFVVLSSRYYVVQFLSAWRRHTSSWIQTDNSAASDEMTSSYLVGT